MKDVIKKIVLGACCSALLCSNAQVFAADGFIVKDIRIKGLKRVSTGTVLNYLPVHTGDELSNTNEVIRALYDTGFFQYVSLDRQGNTLIINVIERATIGYVAITGNKDIPTKKLKEALKQIGLEKGRVFQRSSLDRIKNELKQQYNMRGKYNARVHVLVIPLTQNRVGIKLEISEGRVSRIKDIKLIGNHDFKTDELLSQLALSSSSTFTYFTKKDQYTKVGLDASLEALRSFYLDRGYLKFKIISSQVLLSPDKKYVYINIKIHEGPQYRFAGYDFVGKLILPKERLDAVVEVKKNEVFSRKKVTETISSLGLVYGDAGYGFPAINANPKIDEKNKTVFIIFSIDPGRHVYVRRINFHGNTKTADYVLRNVLQQNEGGLLSLHNIKESERQLRVLGYLKNINVKTTPVPGTNNQVDLDFNVEEAPSAEASASIGYGTNGPQLNANFNQKNFMGTGRTVSVNFNASYWGQDYAFSYYDPFYSKTGIGRGVNIYYSVVDPKNLQVSAYTSDRYGGDLNYNILLSENSSMQLGIGYQDLKIKSAGSVMQIANFVLLNGSQFKQVRLTAGWNRNTYDQMPYPNKGINQQATLLTALPASSTSLSYYKAFYQAHVYQPLVKGFILSLLGNIGYGDSFNATGLPFYENYFAGGIAQPGQVRGYDSYTLGPLDIFGNALGANFLVSGSAALIMPYPLSRETVRTSAFVDAGNVYARGVPLPLQGTASGPIRYSAGVSVDWRSPFGPLSFSVAKPLNKKPFDRENTFQFSVSSGF
jgi:outer membrane protein insertion porin family